MSKIRKILLYLAIISIGALFGGSFLASIAFAPNFRVGIPQSLEHLRQFMAVASPADFFRLIAPIAQISIIGSLILGWKRSAAQRWWLIIALILIVATEVFSFTFQSSRDAILFRDPMHVPPEILAKVAKEWAYGNYLRNISTVTAMICAIKALSLDRDKRDA